ncbi:MAG: hypothetical protein IJO47_01985, partial [Clostridia bacterium]|nr:hypothetical protein [Clostridia bacterium]
MYNPRNYAISIERILKTPMSMTGEIEKDPLTFISSFIDVAYESKEDKRILIDNFKNKYAIYQGVSLIEWYEED